MMLDDTDLAAWHAARAKVVGASEVAALFGCAPDYAMSHFALWHVKAGRMEPPPFKGERPKWGLLLEDAIGQAVRDEHGWLVDKPVLRHVVHPTVEGMGCTLDFFTRKKDGEPAGALEIKNADWLIHRRQWGDEPPAHILLQLQHQLACTGLAWGAVACLVGGNHLELYEYERNAKVCAEIEKRVAAFWRSIREDKAPPVDGSSSTAGALAALYPADDGNNVPADLTGDNELPGLCAAHTDAAARRKAAEDEEKGARNAILAKLGGHRKAWCQGFLISAPAIKESEGTLVTPEMVGTCIGGRAGYRRLSIKETPQ